MAAGIGLLIVPDVTVGKPLTTEDTGRTEEFPDVEDVVADGPSPFFARARLPLCSSVSSVVKNLNSTCPKFLSKVFSATSARFSFAISAFYDFEG